MVGASGSLFVRTRGVDAFEREAYIFKERFFLVRPRTEFSFSNVLKMVERPHTKGGVASTRIPRFHFFWYPDHFEYKPRIFKCKYARLSSREKIDHD